MAAPALQAEKTAPGGTPIVVVDDDEFVIAAFPYASDSYEATTWAHPNYNRCLSFSSHVVLVF